MQRPDPFKYLLSLFVLFLPGYSFAEWSPDLLSCKASRVFEGQRSYALFTINADPWERINSKPKFIGLKPKDEYRLREQRSYVVRMGPSDPQTPHRELRVTMYFTSALITLDLVDTESGKNVLSAIDNYMDGFATAVDSQGKRVAEVVNRTFTDKAYGATWNVTCRQSYAFYPRDPGGPH